MSSNITHVTINLLPERVGPTGRALYRARYGDVQTIYRCTPGEKSLILRAARTLGMSGAEFTRIVMIQVASLVLLDIHETEATAQAVKSGPLRLDPNLPPGVKRS